MIPQRRIVDVYMLSMRKLDGKQQEYENFWGQLREMTSTQEHSIYWIASGKLSVSNRWQSYTEFTLTPQDLCIGTICSGMAEIKTIRYQRYSPILG